MGLFAVKPCLARELSHKVVVEAIARLVRVDERTQFARFVPVVGDGVACGIGAVGYQSCMGVLVHSAVATRVGVAQ